MEKFLKFFKSIQNKSYHQRFIYFWLAVSFSFIISVGLWLLSLKNLVRLEGNESEISQEVNKTRAEFSKIFETLKDTSYNIKALTIDVFKEFEKQDNLGEKKVQNNLDEVVEPNQKVIEKRYNKLPVDF